MIENEGVRVREARRCMLCECEGEMLYANQRDRLFGAPGLWNIRHCSCCQIAWLDPQPIPDDIGKLYAQYFTHQMDETGRRPLAGLRRKVKASILSSSMGYTAKDAGRYLSVLSLISPLREIVEGSVMWLKRPAGGGRLLDVGCGNGRFLDQMRQLGWDVMGVEPDGEAVSVAREKFGLEIFHGSLEDAGFPEEHFDAVTMNHVIEHVPDPIKTLRECARIMKPGGKLVVVTPNIKSVGHIVFKEHWRGLEVPRHLHLFSPRSLRACADRAGLVAQVRTTARSARGMYAASDCIRRDGALPGGVIAGGARMRGLAFRAREQGLRGPGDAGEEIVMEARRG